MRPVRYLICFLFTSFLLSVQAFAQSEREVRSAFAKAERLSNAPDHTDQTDNEALKLYKDVVNALSRNFANTPFSFRANVSTGAFLQVMGKYQESITYLDRAITIKKSLNTLKDSILFRPLVYCGNAYYMLDKPDIAESYYKKAAKLAETFPQVGEQERLFNTLGVISYAKGNYSKSIVYYRKAIRTLQQSLAPDDNLLVVYRSNLASALRKSKRFSEALSLYLSLLPFNINRNEVLHNIGATYLSMGQDDLAISYLKRVGYTDVKKLNDLALAYIHKNEFSSAKEYLNKAENLNKNSLNSDKGITMKYRGDLYFQQHNYPSALMNYQQAIHNFLPGFSANDYRQNPSDFKSVFNGVALLETLTAKARAIEAVYNNSNDLRDIKAELDTYRSFYELADHIAKFYDNDESRALISDRTYLTREEPIRVSLRLYHLTSDPKYLEQAFSFDEQNKAAVLSLNLEAAQLKDHVAPPLLLQQERELKDKITSLSIQQLTGKDASKPNHQTDQINELSIKLLKVQTQIDQKTGFTLTGKKPINLKELQKQIPDDGAILSYHVSNTKVICFVISNDQFSFFERQIDESFLKDVSEINKFVSNTTVNNQRKLRTLGLKLYNLLISPAESRLKKKTQLVIIPDNSLNYLPFELLMSSNNERLLNKFAITYNYSCKILLKDKKIEPLSTKKILGLAPFTGTGITTGNNQNWSALPESKTEIGYTGGLSFTGEQATKQAFLTKATQFDIVHLATHAVANDSLPERSYIAFYPNKTAADLAYKIYMPEIYNMRFAKTRLVVLSACETGAGKLAQGEGVMSLSRAFSYAGCDNIVTSMWKADDRSTAYLMSRFYHYIAQGYGIAESLKLSKIDYVNSPDFGTAKKLPGYWANLRHIGTFGAQHRVYRWYWYPFIIFLIIGIIAIVKSRPTWGRP
ncbi:MAG: CHAT domain-containing protein [Mucilaginibacter sp.]|nr:CHAT domain-containing protein [Mucilaginibacter sp.]